VVVGRQGHDNGASTPSLFAPITPIPFPKHHEYARRNSPVTHITIHRYSSLADIERRLGCASPPLHHLHYNLISAITIASDIFEYRPAFGEIKCCLPTPGSNGRSPVSAREESFTPESERHSHSYIRFLLESATEKRHDGN
jgi:hypothetical protein